MLLAMARNRMRGDESIGTEIQVVHTHPTNANRSRGRRPASTSGRRTSTVEARRTMASFHTPPHSANSVRTLHSGAVCPRTSPLHPSCLRRRCRCTRLFYILERPRLPSPYPHLRPDLRPALYAAVSAPLRTLLAKYPSERGWGRQSDLARDTPHTADTVANILDALGSTGADACVFSSTAAPAAPVKGPLAFSSHNVRRWLSISTSGRLVQKLPSSFLPPSLVALRLASFRIPGGAVINTRFASLRLDIYAGCRHFLLKPAPFHDNHEVLVFHHRIDAASILRSQVYRHLVPRRCSPACAQSSM
ncbi:hypothetical protein B0H19DRAFT_1376973 [Mycena capillaripes]|nr:hypothetical protein B0H19DRAFT_1376973 [Mycena capillaripes]